VKGESWKIKHKGGKYKKEKDENVEDTLREKVRDEKQGCWLSAAVPA
jgi:hypothetical protein